MLENHDLKKLYQDYPEEIKYLNALGQNITKSVILEYNGVYWSVRDSLIKNDVKNSTRIVPSNKENNNLFLQIYGPCIAYGIFTSVNMTIEELIQKYMNFNGINANCINKGVPIGSYFLNDLFYFIHSEHNCCEIDVFINRFSKFVKKFLKKNKFLYFDLKKHFENEHNWFINNPAHLTPYGNVLCTSAILNYLNFNFFNKIDVKFLKKMFVKEDFYLIENSEENYRAYLRNNKIQKCNEASAIVMNASPFTNGHAYLIDYAAAHSDGVYIFVVNNNDKAIPFYDRYQMVKRYCDMYHKNVRVLDASVFTGSSYTFRAYFNKNYDMNIDLKRDFKNFIDIYCKELNIKKRFFGKEYNSSVTNALNEYYKINSMNTKLEVIEIDRLKNDLSYVSASKVRELLKIKAYDKIEKLVPSFVLQYLLLLNDKEIAAIER